MISNQKSAMFHAIRQMRSKNGIPGNQKVSAQRGTSPAHWNFAAR
jgi:hypothetical protein